MAGGKKGNKKGGNGGGAPQKAAEPKEVKKEAKEGGEEQFKFNFGGAGGKGQVFDLAGKDAAILPMIQKKLDTLVGKPSGYFESLPAVVQNRIKALKGLQAKKADLDKEYKKELSALQTKFDKLVEPLYEHRREIVQGAREPTEEELKAAPQEPKKEEEAKEEVKEEGKKEEEEEEEDVKGIPNFWLEAFKHHDDFSEMITPQDEKALKYLTDVKWKPLPAAENRSDSSFSLEFEFKAENPYFEQTTLTKSYYLTEHEQLGETMFDKMEGTDIKWKAGKNLTVRLVQVQTGGKRGGKRGGRGRGKSQPGKTTTVEEPTESFFNFFKSDVASAFGIEADDMESPDDLQELYEADYEMGLAVKEQIIASAVLWFTGEIQDPFGPEGDSEGDEDGEYDSAEDPDFDEDPNQPEGQKPECAQQ